MDKQQTIVHKNAKVLVTGVTGYIGAHVAQQLLIHGYQVKGTVRSTADEAKLNKIRDQIIDSKLKETYHNIPDIEFCEADLLKEDVWAPAVDGCQYVCHVASPFPLVIPNDPDTLIKPAVDGTLFVLRAASNNANVKRVVLTSSLAAIHDVKLLDGKDPDKIYNEDDWVDDDKVEAYSKSKILAEKAAHKFIEDLPQEDGKKKLELVVINPSYVLGPMLTDSVSSSVLGIKRMLDKTAPFVPKFNMAFCDVRDVALAHVKALESPEHVGKRYLIFTESRWMKDIAKLIQKEFKPLGYFVPSMTVPSALVWLGSFVDKSTAMIVPRLDKEFKLDNKRMVEDLKITPTDVEKTVIDTCYSLIEKGIIKPTKKFKKVKQPEQDGAAAATSGDNAEQQQTGGDVPAQQPVKVEG